MSQVMGVVCATGGREISRRMVTERASQRAFFGVSALLFAASAAVTIVWCASMSAMGEMPMPGDWTMSTAWMRMPGQTWPAAAASFLGMWVVMMMAMMLPSLVPMLWRYRQACDAIEGHCCRVFADPNGKDNHRSTQRHVPLGKTIPQGGEC